MAADFEASYRFEDLVSTWGEDYPGSRCLLTAGRAGYWVSLTALSGTVLTLSTCHSNTTTDTKFELFENCTGNRLLPN